MLIFLTILSVCIIYISLYFMYLLFKDFLTYLNNAEADYD